MHLVNYITLNLHSIAVNLCYNLFVLRFCRRKKNSNIKSIMTETRKKKNKFFAKYNNLLAKIYLYKYT